MLSQDEKVKQSLIKATESVRQKYKDLINNRVETSRLLERHYKPITNKLGTLIDLNKKSHVGDHIDGASSTSRAREGMHTPRPRGRPRKHKRFEPPATPINAKKVRPGSNRKSSTPTIATLYEQPSFPKNPKIVLHRVMDNQQPSTSAQTTPRNVRFLNDDEAKRKRKEGESPIHPIIKPGRRITRANSARERLFDDSRMDVDEDSESSTENVVSENPAPTDENPVPRGSGLYKKATKTNKTTYVYWDNVNELVSRLRLLVASQTAGHSGHHNEIISIVEELREAGVVK